MVIRPTAAGGSVPTRAVLAPISWFTYCIIKIVSITFLTLWLRTIVLDPLKVEAVIMAHLDPTDVVAQAFSLRRLALFVGGSAVALLGAQLLLAKLSRVSDVIMTITVVYATMVLCGAHPIHNFLHTALATVYLSLLLLSATPNKKNSYDTAVTWWKESLVWKETMPRDACVGFVQLYATILISIPFQILHILDWGSQIQRWPLPVVLGNTVGYIVGTLVGMLYASIFLHPKAL